MRLDTRHALIEVNATQPLSLTQAQGTRLRGVSGTTWVTIDNQAEDIVLSPGDEWVVASTHRVLVTSLHGKSSVDLSAPPDDELPPSHPGLWATGLGRLAHALSA